MRMRMWFDNRVHSRSTAHHPPCISAKAAAAVPAFSRAAYLCTPDICSLLFGRPASAIKDRAGRRMEPVTGLRTKKVRRCVNTGYTVVN
ncbi:hypothetical protein BAUCODRAFT_34941 [Baudoinia panamericana UAMH 10762]|uniref:Uncharacterized protein n=1 Tax=Baudoinia panamericana (strain UAMH 10762) TaxID=717646 RepID=M2N808_BAUPA|nr:uncharacterized protein BAUCODRAFT_34941 [Baudoinia panamericana UAMH 10762]EMC94935.1 hypothetical protein BAUCODRAFT_34941 [Baudoinia panamericana UAMH 10762]